MFNLSLYHERLRTLHITAPFFENVLLYPSIGGQGNVLKGAPGSHPDRCPIRWIVIEIWQNSCVDLQYSN